MKSPHASDGKVEESTTEPTKPMVVITGGASASGKTFFCDSLRRHFAGNAMVTEVGIGETEPVWHQMSSKEPHALVGAPPVAQQEPSLERAILDAGEGGSLGGKLLLYIETDTLGATRGPTALFFVVCQTAALARSVYATMRLFVPKDEDAAFATLHLVRM